MKLIVPLYNPSPPPLLQPPPLVFALGRPFRAVRSRSLSPPAPPTPPLHSVMFWAVHLGPSGAQLANSFPFELTPTSFNHEHWLTNSQFLYYKKKKILSSPSSPPSLRPTRMEPPSYDSRVHGLTRLLGTSPPRSSPFPHPPPLPVCLPVRLSF